MNQRDYWLQRWAQALRSGKYTQAVNRWQDDAGGRCAQTVLYEEGRQDGFHSYEMVPMVGNEAHATARAMNDAGRSFRDIADWLETQAQVPLGTGVASDGLALV